MDPGSPETDQKDPVWTGGGTPGSPLVLPLPDRGGVDIVFSTGSSSDFYTKIKDVRRNNTLEPVQWRSEEVGGVDS